uniref:C2 NT-type domain-containing protein n=1 Tax=Macrostomum lignano TaxID=282301 RepID=A0A1I8FPI6_9PLAT
RFESRRCCSGGQFSNPLAYQSVSERPRSFSFSSQPTESYSHPHVGGKSNVKLNGVSCCAACGNPAFNLMRRSERRSQQLWISLLRVRAVQKRTGLQGDRLTTAGSWRRWRLRAKLEVVSPARRVGICHVRFRARVEYCVSRMSILKLAIRPTEDLNAAAVCQLPPSLTTETSTSSSYPLYPIGKSASSKSSPIAYTHCPGLTSVQRQLLESSSTACQASSIVNLDCLLCTGSASQRNAHSDEDLNLSDTVWYWQLALVCPETARLWMETALPPRLAIKPVVVRVRILLVPPLSLLKLIEKSANSRVAPLWPLRHRHDVSFCNLSSGHRSRIPDSESSSRLARIRFSNRSPTPPPSTTAVSGQTRASCQYHTVSLKFKSSSDGSRAQGSASQASAMYFSPLIVTVSKPVGRIANFKIDMRLTQYSTRARKHVTDARLFAVKTSSLAPGNKRSIIDLPYFNI